MDDVTGPVEIPLRRKYARASSSSQPSPKSGNSGGKKKQPHWPTAMVKGEREASMAVTAANRRVLLLIGGKHRRFVRADSL